jgi:antitoxin component of RelBE/YafQ-DinJ toxin-antitoxin module
MNKKNGRVYIRIDPELKEQVQAYCDRRHTTISDIISRFLARVIEEDKKQEEAPQI